MTHVPFNRNTPDALKSLNTLNADYLTICMPKPGYTCITVPVQLYNMLKSEASRIGCSIPELIRRKLGTSTFFESTSTPIRSTSTNGGGKSHNLSLFSRKQMPRAGLEPATIRSSAGRSPRLSYRGLA